MIELLANSPMELASDTKHLKYSPTSTPILDLLRPLPERRWLRMNAGEYFFLSGAVILVLIGAPVVRNLTESLAWPSPLSSVLMACVFIPAAALALSLAAHEGGHLAAAWLAGFASARPRRAADEGVERGGEWACDILRVASCSLEPLSLEGIRKRLFLLFAAGPAANLAVPAILELLSWIGSWSLVTSLAVHVFAGISVLQGIADLIPDSGRGSFSDGSRMLMLLKKNDALAQRWLGVIEMLVRVRHGENPAAWEEAKVVRLTTVRDETRDAVAARWVAYQWATRRQDITTATRYLEEALEIPHAAAGKLCDRLFFEAALFQAWFRDDAEKARTWAGHMRHASAGQLQQPRLRIALMWADGKLFDAWEQLRDYLGHIQELPSLPSRDLAEKQALEWKAQMESRMLTRAWRTIYSMSQEVEKSAPEAEATRV